MIAAHHVDHVFAAPIHDPVRVRTVADQVATIQDLVIEPLGIGQHRFQSFPIGVNVAYDEIAHSLMRATSGRAPKRAGNPTVPTPRVTKMADDASRYKPST